MEKREIGATGVYLTPLGFGTSGLGDMPDTYGYSVDEARAQDTVRAIFDGPAQLIDTSNNYGQGRSEQRVGAVIKADGLPEGFTLSTKLDRDNATGRFDAARAWASLEESCERLGVDEIPLLFLHDPEHARDLGEIEEKGGALDALFEMKEKGRAKAVGLAMGRLDIMEPMLRSRPFDALISHNRFTLLNRSAAPMFDYAAEQEIAVINAAPFAGGVLAKGAEAFPRISYQEVGEEKLAPVRQIEAICARFGVPVGAVALQFSMRDPRVTTTLLGVTKPERVAQALDWAAVGIPDDLWEALGEVGSATSDPEADRVYKNG
ncbi:aldo/keto reductase [Celeribacter sp.]|uniref:aldo/keto reductase n=1 Tax=Celeribacter sp. TaxID=1890673 RepID=UPI003A8F03EB